MKYHERERAQANFPVSDLVRKHLVKVDANLCVHHFRIVAVSTTEKESVRLCGCTEGDYSLDCFFYC